MSRHHLLLMVLVSVFASTGASYRTANFTVEAPTDEIAEQIGKAAEYWRKREALEWIGREIPAWSQPCPVRVTLSLGSSGGATTFGFGQGRVFEQSMRLEGTLNQMLDSLVPHEVTHTVFADYFGRPVPRWFDEGGAMLSEDASQRLRHEKLVRQVLAAPQRAIPLGRLLVMREYPPDMTALYAEGCSLTRFLVNSGDRRRLLAFVDQGSQGDWDKALQNNYCYFSVARLEKAWLDDLDRAGLKPFVVPTARFLGFLAEEAAGLPGRLARDGPGMSRWRPGLLTERLQEAAAYEVSARLAPFLAAPGP